MYGKGLIVLKRLEVKLDLLEYKLLQELIKKREMEGGEKKKTEIVRQAIVGLAYKELDKELFDQCLLESVKMKKLRGDINGDVIGGGIEK